LFKQLLNSSLESSHALFQFTNSVGCFNAHGVSLLLEPAGMRVQR
jgi:hypothetical protein